MKNTIKFILVILFAFISIDGNGQVSIVKGGLNLSRIFEKNRNLSYDKSNFHKGFHLGVSYEKKISDVFFLGFEPMLQTKGAIEESYDGSYFTTTNFIYFDIPVLMKGYFELDDDALFYTTLGPYLGFGLLGNYEGRNAQQDGRIAWGGADGGSNKEYARLDFGFSLGAGFDFNGVQVGFSYDFSLFDIVAHPSVEYGIIGRRKHRVIRLSLGYRFRKVKKKEE